MSVGILYFEMASAAVTVRFSPPQLLSTSNVVVVVVVIILFIIYIDSGPSVSIITQSNTSSQSNFIDNFSNVVWFEEHFYIVND